MLILRIACFFAIACCMKAADESVVENFLAEASPPTKRHSEGDIIALKDGTLLAAWSDFYGGAGDFAAARISAVKSSDGGRTWGPRFTLQENVGSTNVMSVSLLRTAPAGEILFFYLVKNSSKDLKLMVRRSKDEAKTWSEPVLVTPGAGYHVMNNARVIQLRSGRLLCPVAFTEKVGDAKAHPFRTVVFVSDDQGLTWRRGGVELSCPARGAMEPGLVELADGRVLQIIRTQTGYIWHSISSDGGDTWTEPSAWTVVSPESPATLSRIPDTKDLLLVWNPKTTQSTEKSVLGANHGGPRTPLAAAISHDEGKTWSPPKLVESDATATYAYTSLTFHEGRALLSYYFASGRAGTISLKFKSLPLSWFQQ